MGVAHIIGQDGWVRGFLFMVPFRKRGEEGGGKKPGTNKGIRKGGGNM